MNCTWKTVAVALSVALMLPGTVFAFNFNKMMDKVSETVNSGVKAVEKGVEDLKSDLQGNNGEKQVNKAAASPKQQPPKTTGKDKTAAGASGSGVAEGLNGSLFSKSPIDPNNPPKGVTAFEVGDNIYGILKTKSSWKKATGSTYILMYLHVDGKQKAYKSVNMQRAELYNSNYFIIDKRFRINIYKISA